MSLFDYSAAEPDPRSYLGALEITSFDGTAANDNGYGGAIRGQRRTNGRWWVLPVVAFSGGLTAALIVTNVGGWLGITG